MLRDGPVLVLGGGSNLLFAGDPRAWSLCADRRAASRSLEDDGADALSCAPKPASTGTTSCCGRWRRACAGWRTWR